MSEDPVRTLSLDRVRRSWPTLFPDCANPSCGGRLKRWPRLWSEPKIKLNGHAYCSADCWEQAAKLQLQRLLSRRKSQPSTLHRVPLGLLLLSRGMLTDSQLRLALDVQQQEGHGKLGDWLIKLGYATEEQITAALGMQWGCPVYPLRTATVPTYPHPLPTALLEAGQMVPVHVQPEQKEIYFAFLERIEYTILYAIELMTGYRTVPCVASPSLVKQVLELVRGASTTHELVFDAPTNLHEMTRILRSYVDAIRAIDVATSECSQFIWLRCISRATSTDLLFRRSPHPTALVC